MTRTLNNRADILSFLESALRSDGCAEILITCGDSRTAKFYIKSKLIAWAIASEQAESFQSILINEFAVSKEQLVAAVRAAKQAGQRTIDSILSSLEIKEHERREISRRHIVSAINSVFGWGECSVNLHSIANDQLQESGFSLSEVVREHNHPSSGAPLFKVPLARPTETPGQIKPQTIVEKREFTDILALLRYFRDQIPLFRAGMLIDMKTGMPIASISDTGLNVEAASAYYRDVVQAAAESYVAIGHTGGNTSDVLEELIICGSSDQLLLRRLPSQEHVLLIMLSADGNPALARIVAKRHLQTLARLLS